MKKLLLFAVFLLATAPVIFGQNVYLDEDFNSGIPSTWTNTNISGSYAWMHGSMQITQGKVNIDGTAMVYFNDDSLGSANQNNKVSLTTPTISALANLPLYLEFDFSYRQYGAINDSFIVEVYDGTNWQMVFSQSTKDNYCWQIQTSCFTHHAKVDISSLVNSNMKIRFIYSDDNNWGFYTGFDNVFVWAPYEYDIQANSIVEPISNCGLTTVNQVKISLTNIGFKDLVNFPISYKIDNNTTITETVVDTIKRDSTYEFTFNQTADLSTMKKYGFTVYTSLSTDMNLSNDTLRDSIENITPIIPDYSESFENGGYGWLMYGQNSSIEIGKPAGTFIKTATDGLHIAGTNVDGFYNSNEMSYLETPCFDFSTSTGAPFITFDLNHFTKEKEDRLWLEESYDGGITWDTVEASINSLNWYNNVSAKYWEGTSNGWIGVENVLPNAIGEGSAKFRFAFKSDGGTELDGFGLDNFKIYNPKAYDIKMVEIVKPRDTTSECGYRDGEELIVNIFNQGSNTITQGTLNYRINSGPGSGTTIYSDSRNLNIPPNSPYTFVHKTPIDLGVSGTYDIDVWMDIPNEGYRDNDSILGLVIKHTSIDSMMVNFSSKPYNPGPASKNWVIAGGGYTWKMEQQTTGGNSGPLADHTGDMNGFGWYIHTNVPPFTPDGSVTTFTSPCFNFGMTNGAVVSFWYHKFGNAMGNLFVDVYDPVTDSWIVATTIIGQTHRSKEAKWLEETIRITTNYSSKIRFRGVSKGYTAGNMAIDDIEVYPPDPIDAKLKAVLEPNTDCNLSINEKFVIQIANFGLDEIDTLPICYTFDTLVPGGPDTRNIICDTAYNVGILPGAILTYIFPDYVDLSTYDSLYTIDIWIDVPRDKRSRGDSLHYIVINETQHFPYCEDFSEALVENGVFWERGYFNTFYKSDPVDDNLYSWRASAGRPSSQTGPPKDHTSTVDPNQPSKFMYIHAANGQSPPPSQGSLTTPCIDLTNTPSANLEFWYHMFGSGIGQLHIDVDAGGGFIPSVFVIDSTQHFSKTADWKLKTLSLSMYTGNFVKVRFRSIFKGAAGEIGLDDICVVIPEPQQLAVDTIISPDRGRCNYWEDEVVRVRVRNVGRDDLDSIVVSYAFDPSWDGNNNNFNPGTEIYETFYPGLPLQPGDTMTLSFTTPAHMRTYEYYRFRAIGRQPGDIGPDDDTAFINVEHPVPINLPYEEDFENLPLQQSHFFNNDWVENGNVDYYWQVRSGSIMISGDWELTGPISDHTLETSFGKYLMAREVPPPIGNPIPGDLAIVSTPCFALPDQEDPSIDFWYHKFGWQMGNMYLEVFNDTVWVEIGKIIKQTHIGNYDEWTQTRIPLTIFDHQNAKFRWKGAYGGRAGHMAIDDIYIGKMPQFDLNMRKVLSPNGSQFECYSQKSVVEVEIENTGVQAWDFSKDTVIFQVQTSINGVVENTIYDTLTSNQFNEKPNVNKPLDPGNSAIFSLYPVDLSKYNELYDIRVALYSPIDTANHDNDTIRHTITPTINAGDIAAVDLLNTKRWQDTAICFGSPAKLEALGFQGEITWQKQINIPGAGIFWTNVIGVNNKSVLIDFPDTSTYYRIKVCNEFNSDSVLYSTDAFGGYDSVFVEVTKVPVPVPVHDTVCEAGMITLAPNFDPILDSILWYDSLTGVKHLYKGMVYSGWFTKTDTFYLEGHLDGCAALDRSVVFAKVPDYPVVDLGKDTIICPDSVYYLNAGGGAGYNYEWKMDGNPVPDSLTNDSVQTIGINAFLVNKWGDSTKNETIITFSTKVTSPFKCTTYDTVTVTVLREDNMGYCVVGLDEESKNANMLQVYPNPTSGKMNIYLNMPNISEAQLEMYSVDGKAVIENEQIVPQNFNRAMDLSAYPNGIYFIKVTTDESTTVKRVVLTK